MAFDDTYGPGSFNELETEELGEPRTGGSPDLPLLELLDDSEVADRFIYARHAGKGGTAEVRFLYTDPVLWVYTIIDVHPVGVGLYTELLGRYAISAINRGVTLFVANYVATERATAALIASGWTFNAEGIATATPEVLLAYSDSALPGGTL